MKLAENPFTHALAAGDKQVGLWISLCSNFEPKSQPQPAMIGR